MPSTLKLRIWQDSDAEFIVFVRNCPALRQWFKQDHDLTVAEQLEFMYSKAPQIGYYGFIIEAGNAPIGITALRIDKDNKNAEFSLAILPKYQREGYSLETVNQVLSIGFNNFCLKRIYGDVFVRNPALSFFLHKCGFKAMSVTENKYHKKNAGPIDVVNIEQTRNENPRHQF